jgi:type IV pilus assembly protein PilB
LIRRICTSCRNPSNRTPTKICTQCKGTGFFGRIGVHEVLSATHLSNPSLPNLTLYDAGLQHIEHGLIHQSTLDDEVGTWH